ncbi:MAG: hypothetical protein KGO05_07930 [Chloroflexota bacterium]|nr:hypothetical protein [Chloroflexota bacterium]
MTTRRAPDDDDLQVSALSPHAPRVWRLWEKRTRLLLVFALALVVVAGAAVGVTLRKTPLRDGRIGRHAARAIGHQVHSAGGRG